MLGRRSVRRRPTAFRSVTGGVVIASQRTGDALFLPATAAAVWDLIEDRADEDAIALSLQAQFPDVDPTEIRRSVTEILGVLDDEGLLEGNPT